MSSSFDLQELVDKLVNQDTIHRPSARYLVQTPYFGWAYCTLVHTCMYVDEWVVYGLAHKMEDKDIVRNTK